MVGRYSSLLEDGAMTTHRRAVESGGDPNCAHYWGAIGRKVSYRANATCVLCGAKRRSDTPEGYKQIAGLRVDRRRVEYLFGLDKTAIVI